MITGLKSGINKLAMNTTATDLNVALQTISITEVTNGVRFAVDANNRGPVKEASPSDFQVGD